MAVELKALAPKEAVKFFRAKGYKLGFDWRDTSAQVHAHYFTVAKVAQYDLLTDIRVAVDAALEQGQTFKQFKTTLEPILRAKGWWGRKPMLDPKTGLIREVQLGSPRRMKIIFDTNLRMAYAKGQWEGILANKKERPFLRYSAVEDERTRPTHKLWHGMIRPVDDPLWDKVYPPNGFRCRCSVQQLSKRDLDREGWKVSPPYTPVERRWYNPRTGEERMGIEGVDLGFDHNVGLTARRFDPSYFAREGQGKFDRLATTWQKLHLKTADQLARRTTPKLVTATDRLAQEKAFMKALGLKDNKDQVHIRARDGIAVRFDMQVFNYAVYGEKRSGSTRRATPDRAKFVNYIKPTLQDPDEVWLVMRKDNHGTWHWRQRYLRFYEDGKGKKFLLVTNFDRDGWGSWTFHPDKNINGERQGILIYKKVE